MSQKACAVAAKLAGGQQWLTVWLRSTPGQYVGSTNRLIANEQLLREWLEPGTPTRKRRKRRKQSAKSTSKKRDSAERKLDSMQPPPAAASPQSPVDSSS